MKIKKEVDLSFVLRKQRDKDAIHYDLLINGEKCEQIIFAKSKKHLFNSLPKSCNILLNVRREQYSTLDKAIALWGLEDPRKPRTVYELKVGDVYWNTGNENLPEKETWHDLVYDIAKREIGDCYLTEEDCQKAIDKRLATQRVLKAIREYNNGWEPNWENGNQYKYLFTYHYSGGFINKIGALKKKTHDDEYYLKDSEIKITSELEKGILLMLGVEE